LPCSFPFFDLHTNSNSGNVQFRLKHYKVVKLLLADGADVNAKASKAGKNYTPLSIAKEMGHTQIIKLLKEYGAKD